MTGSEDWLAAARSEAGCGEGAVLVTVAGVQGSAPREVGASMVVTRDALFGSVGGGVLEHMAIQKARHGIREGELGLRLLSFPLTPDSLQCCGGVVVLLFETLDDGHWAAAVESQDPGSNWAVVTGLADRRWQLESREQWDRFPSTIREWLADQAGPNLALLSAGDRQVICRCVQDSRPTVAVFGAGHVGRALISALAPLPFALWWIDSRTEAFPDDASGDAMVHTPDHPESVAQALPQGSAVLVMTHQHAVDYQICRAALGRGDLGFVGLIGSVTKRRRFVRRLIQEGMDPEPADRLVCPIGLPGIEGKQPAVIAAAVAAQLLSLQARRESASGISEQQAERSPIAGQF